MPYHSKLDAFHKKEAQDKFKNNEISVVLASKAFGMGVDISDIENVYHHAPSSSLSDYVQEIGRAARTKSIQGKSITFFNDNDLQYSVKFFGLSSIKQYQIKWILKKLISLYVLYGSIQNMLINTDDFKHIFGDNSNKNNEVDNKIQSCLMMIEKDFQNNAGFPVILARPKRLFGKVFAEVPISKESEFKKLFSKYIKLIKKSTSDSSMVSYDRFGRRTEIITPGTTNPIYLIHLDLLWEEIDQFRKMNFAQLKSLFFKRELFFKNKKNADEEQEEEKVSPIQRLEISFNSGYDKNLILFEFEEIWEKLINIFISFNGKYFTRSDFISKVRIYFPDKSSSYYNGFEELLTIFKVRAKSLIIGQLMKELFLIILLKLKKSLKM